MPDRFAYALLSLALTAGPLACTPRASAVQGPDCIVSKVVDGDTFHCQDGRKVRLIGIDSPERLQGPFGARSRGALLGLLQSGAPVRLERDVAATDQYGRVLAYAWLGTSLLNEAMVRGGWAVLYTVPPNVKYADRLRRAQNEARAGGAGLWAQNGFACLPSEFRRKACVSPP
jgi:micrococcal nuclease